MKSLFRKTAPWVLLIVIAGLGWFATASAGIQVHYVNSGSMEPVIPVHSVVITYETSDLKKNDVITFHNRDRGILTTHIFGGYAKDGTLKTKGAANRTPDNFTAPPRMEDVEGKVWRRIDLFTLIGVAALLIAASLLWPSKSEVEVAAQSASQDKEPAPTPA
jgi:signal peptidase I